MSFQAPGTGISGTSNQFAVGYAGNAGTSGYAPSAGNINGYAPQAGYANQGAATATNIQSAQGVNGTNWAWSGQNGTPGHLWGGNVGSQYAVWQYGQMYIGSTGNATYAGSAANSNGYAPIGGYTNQLATQGGNGNATTWGWNGQGGTPSHWWGSNDGNYMAVWQYGQMYCGSVNSYATNAGYANTVGGSQVFGYSNQANSFDGNSNGIGGNTSGGWRVTNSGYASGYTMVIQTQGTDGAFFNTRRNTTNDGNRFLVYYNPENNVGSQWGAFSGNWYNTSDAREKEDIEDLDETSAINFIKQLRPRKYRWKKERIGDYQIGTGDELLKPGFVAQEVLLAANTNAKSFLHIVNNGKQYLEAGGSIDITNLEGMSNTVPILGVSQEQIVSPLVKTVQALMNDVQLLKLRISVLKPKFNIQ
jgi:hypothetical protein